MNFKTTYILAGVLLALVGLFVLIVILGTSTQPEGTYVLPSLNDSKDPVHATDIDYVQIERFRPKAEKLVFVRDPDTQDWFMTEPYELPVDRYQVSQIFEQVQRAQINKKRDVTSNLAQWELDSPNAVVTLKKGQEREWKVNLGAQSGGTSGVVYVTSSDRPKEPMAVDRSQVNILFKTVNDFRSRTIFADNATTIESFKVQDKDREVALEKYSDNRWRYLVPKGYGAAELGGGFNPVTRTPTGGVHGLLETLTNLRVEFISDKKNDFVEEDAKDLARYGLDGSKGEFLTLEVKLKEGEKKKEVTETLLVGKPVEEKSDKEKGEKEKDKTDKEKDKDKEKADKEKDEKRYARLAGDKRYANHVFKISKRSLEPFLALLKDPSSLRDRDLVRLDVTKTDAIDIKSPGNPPLKLRRLLGVWKLFVGDDTKAVDADAMQVGMLLNELDKATVLDFVEESEAAKRGLGKPDADLVLTVWEGALDDNQPADQQPKFKADVKPKLKLLFGEALRKDDKGKKVYVRRLVEDQDLGIVTLPLTLVEQIDKSNLDLAFYARKLPPRPEKSKEIGLLVKRGDGTYDISREPGKDDKEDGPWLLKEPKGNADAGSVWDLIFKLRDLTPLEFIKKQPKDEDLEKYGLKKPQYEVTITFLKDDKKEEKRTYLFGNTTNEGKAVYAMLGKGSGLDDLVFTVPNEAFQQKNLVEVLSSELRDRKVLTFEPAKVKLIKLTGWKKELGLAEPEKLELERKSSRNWVVKAGPKIALDERKPENFIDMLSQLAAERFVKGSPKPEYQLDAQNGGLEIEIVLEGDKPDETKTLTLILGEPDPEAKAPKPPLYFAATSKPPKEVFLVPQAPFKDLRSGYKYFSK